MNYDEVIEQLKKRQPQAIILFGSHAWGRPHEDSDLDILLIEETEKPFPDRMRDAREELRTNQAIDILVLTPKEAQLAPQKDSFYKQIFTEGKLLYGRLPEVAA
ncbi:TPA: nucleotidyltransferase domain-containing protein [Patescibacteria group bacterium]|uniref:Polymerase, beta domain protein region protein n=1 Tax=Candidatus Gottesmanbacteria bacterium GW2011_GWA1_43_11 TaxID=1618436 RepID=A0A0G1FGS9_9BACT|nr:MAG: polymerase, beta domain protein region protein [Candidatus Gottesmanbacteria bacterium GW2011_GWA1_43_11]HCS78129.1 nucleotidyltransferase domain-containing protein [Patescibacteria group bacterium]